MSTLLDATSRAALQRRTLRVVVASQVLGGAGLAAGITVGALLAADLLGSPGAAGLPIALITLGSAVAAWAVGRTTQRLGRRTGLGAGFLVGAVGAAGVVVGAATDQAWLALAAMVPYGAGTATNLQARYAGTDLALPAERGTAVSTALVATTLGAVAGPNLVGPLGDLAAGLGLPPLTGPFLLSGAAYAAAGLVLVALLRPDPFLVARSLPREDGSAAGVPAGARAGLAVGATVMVVTQVAMVAIMTMTPVHMREHDHGLSAVGLVIGLHVAAMFLPSLVTGPLVDRVGRVPMAAAGGVVLLLAGVTAALAPADGLVGLVLALVLLGLGWNIGLIAGTTLVVDATTPEERGRVQGSLDVLVALGGAGAAALSGLVVAGSSYSVLALGGGVLSLLLVPVVLRARR
ncbi:MFS transporter [Nocardioides marmoraquaticus]